MWLRILQHLLPTSVAWTIVIEKLLRRFFAAMASIPTNVETFVDSVFADIDPQRTRELDAWERQFGLDPAGLTEQERRTRYDGAWKATGGQSPNYIQSVLQNAGFNVFVHEWFEPVPGRPGGGSVNNDVTPVARIPSVYLSGADPNYLGQDGEADMQDGEVAAQDGNQTNPPGYLLVNKIVDNNGDPVEYAVPVLPAQFPYVLYVGGETFPDVASVPINRREEFENLCLKICPTEQWIGVLVSYA